MELGRAGGNRWNKLHHFLHKGRLPSAQESQVDKWTIDEILRKSPLEDLKPD